MCIFCGATMDSRDGHRECPGCLGRAHLLGDVKNPCPAALDLPLEERARRAGLQAAPVSLTDSSSTHGGQSYEPEVKSSKRKHRSSHKPPHKHKRRRTADAVDSPALPPSSPVRDSVEKESMYTQLLAAVRGLTDRVNSFETHPRQAEAEAVGSAEASLDHLPSFQEQRHPDTISLYAQGSLLGVGQDQGNPEGGHSGASSYPGDSTSGGDGTDVAGAVDLAEKVLTAAKIVGLAIPVQGASPADGVWAGIVQSQPTVSLPATDDFCQMLRKTWDAPSKPCQFNAGCRKLARVSYPQETGLGDMPPVEREVAALTSSGPPRLTADPHCPWRECDRTDRLVCKAYNASARAARSGNALAVLLAAVRKTVGAGDQDTKDLMDAALSALAQMTRDVGSAMSSATRAHRQIWLAQTALPEGVRAELINMPVLPAKVFHPDSQSVLVKAQESVRACEGVKR